MNWLKAHKHAILRLVWVAAPILAGVVSGGVFTAPVLMAAVGSIAGTYAQHIDPPAKKK